MKSLTTKSVYHDKYMLLCFFVTFFQPLMLWNREPFNYMFRIMQFVVWVIVALSSVVRWRKWNLYLWLWTFFCFIEIAVILINSSAERANPVLAVETVISLLFLVHFLDVFFVEAERRELIFFWSYLFCMIALELISIPLCKAGLISIYWLGIKTRATEPIIAFLLLTLLLRKEIKKERYYIGIALSVIIIILLKISTAVIGIAIIAMFTWVAKKPRLKRLLKLLQPSVIIGVSVALTIGILFFDIQTRFSSLIGLAFSKDITFSGRSELWKYGISMIQNDDVNHQLWGYGFYNVSLWVKWQWYTIITESHDQLLQMVHDTGIIGTILMYLTFHFQLRGLNKCKNILARNLIAAVCFAMMIMCITEIYSYHSYFYIIFAIAARSKNIIENRESIRKSIRSKNV